MLNKEKSPVNLQHVGVSKKNIDLSHFPDFLIVGPQRTGTSWLYKNLAHHPELFLSKKKEIHFFNLLNKPNHPMYKTHDISVYLENFYDTPRSYIYKNIICYANYRQLYRPKIRGEATASYAAMEEELVAEVVALNPNVKVILTIRDPIERAWSHAKKDLIMRRKLQSVEDLSKKEVENFINDKYQLACGNYTASVDKWSKYLLKGNLFIGLFDEIIDTPVEYLIKVYLFLGVSANQKFTQYAKNKINPSNKDVLPSCYQGMLKEIFSEELQRLNSRYGIRWDV